MRQDMMAEKLKKNGLPNEERLARLLSDYLGLLQDWNQKMDLTAVLDEEEMADRHFMDSLTILKTKELEEAQTLLDVGTGAGFPGLVLALAMPDLQVTLMDAQQKRLRFLEAVCEKTGTKNVKLIHGRAEDYGKKPEMREIYDVAVARAVAPLNVLSELLLPFVRIGGKMICWKGPALRDELESGRRAAHLLGGRIEMPLTCPVFGRDWEHYLLPVQKVQATPRLYPRKAGVPKEKPLGV